MSCQNATQICLSALPRVDSGDGGGFVTNALQIVIAVIAAIAVLMIAIGGMRYVLSQGDPKGVETAKSTILYAVIGLVVAILAQGIVVFVVNRVTG